MVGSAFAMLFFNRIHRLQADYPLSPVVTAAGAALGKLGAAERGSELGSSPEQWRCRTGSRQVESDEGLSKFDSGCDFQQPEADGFEGRLGQLGSLQNCAA